MRRLPGTARSRPASRLVAAVILLGSAAGSCAGDDRPAPALPTTTQDTPAVIEPPAKAAVSVTVQRVIDVRTVQLSDGAEVTVKGLAAPDGCWTEASTTFAKAMLLDKLVDPTPAGSLRLADGTDYALLAVELGMVRSEASGDRAMQEAEQTASAKRLGRWGPPCVQPTSATPPPAKPTTTAPPAPQPVTGCSVEYRVTHSWPGGFRTDVTIRNTGNTEITGWTLQWKFANGQKVSEMWNATLKQSGQDISATAMPYNQAIGKGESLLMGFNGISGGTNTAPNAFSLNGHACKLG
ncbi:cellulose binding domain-containing protein [Lentzea atacamensis]|uniref:Cellulose binding domain-containing protein n=1 Tax=Lentzea atacamensis TaxID=531938 RepID=A0ABX9E9U4_9PSEU|nr:cellulose-binding domain-containing protein [Lentzea atacamensis]RAS66926.1 cellulose binding domain-containing protein [Lentzea atacamensis]